MDEREYMRLLTGKPPPLYSHNDRSTVNTSFSPQPVPNSTRRNDTLCQQAVNAPLRQQPINTPLRQQPIERRRQVPNGSAQGLHYDKLTACIIIMTTIGVVASGPGMICLGLCAIPVCCCLCEANEANELRIRERHKKSACGCSFAVACFGVWCYVGWIGLIVYIILLLSN